LYYNKELNDAKSKIDSLEYDITHNVKRVYIRSQCPSASDNTTDNTTGSMGNATTSQLDRGAGQDYIRLIRLMDENRIQTLYLQDYIKTQCYYKLEENNNNDNN
jgi:prophage endopeptidase